ncbi:MAG: hypothetical protein RR585_06885 [Coprobacillus sp.]
MKRCGRFERYIKIIIALIIMIPMIGVNSLQALDKQSISNIKTDVSNSIQYSEDLEKEVNGDTVIDDNQTPLARADGAWALSNFICVLLTIISGFILLVSNRYDEDTREDYEVETVEEYRRKRWTKLSTFIVSIVSIVVFILTEDVTLPMQFIDKYTMIMVMILIVQLVVLLVGRKWKKEKKIQINNI